MYISHLVLPGISRCISDIPNSFLRITHYHFSSVKEGLGDLQGSWQKKVLLGEYAVILHAACRMINERSTSFRKF